jgi:DoxX-like family
MKVQSPFNRADRMRAIAYWTFTLPVAFENAAGALWVLLRIEYPRLILAHLGYPQYLQYILGPWELAGAAALVAPRLPRIKEWAYAGAFFKYSAAFVSFHFASVFVFGSGLGVTADRPDIGAAIMAVSTLISWALRPPDRRLAERPPVGEASVLPWIASAVILGLLLILSLFLLPKGVPPR